MNELLIGSTLQFPLYDAAGVLLLAEGTTISTTVKEKLGLRDFNNVQIHAEDVKNVTLDTSFVKDRKQVSISQELAKQFDSMFSDGANSLKNDGPAVQDQMVFNGRKAYDTEKREELLKQHKTTSDSLDNMMRDAVHGKVQSGKQITQLVANYLTDMSEDSENVLTTAMEADNRGLSEQSLQTSLLAMTIGVEMRLNAENVRVLGLCGLVHDWGMTRVPKEILNKQGPLTAVEFLEVQKHPIHSIELLQRMTGIPNLVPLVVYQVHERLNGIGYPRGRRGNSIHPFARILNVADTYTALTSPRYYRPALSGYAAMECLLHLAAKKSVDPLVVTALLNAFSLFPIGSFVGLDDGSVAQVLRPNRGEYHKPIVQLVKNTQGELVPESDEAIVDLLQSERTIEQGIPTPGKQEIGFLPGLVTGSAGTAFRAEEI